jgi:hypothetical protein
MSISVNFAEIRGDTVQGKRAAFEQLVCHLARLDKQFPGEFRRIEGAGGDGGVEAIRILPHGGEIGFQAKYHPKRGEIDWAKIDKSVEQALKHHPALKRYIVALPCDFTGRRGARGGRTDGVWGKWDAQVKHWENWADTDAQHLLRYFFDRLAFSCCWMQRQLERTLDDLRARYSPAEHVDTNSLRVFDVIFRRENVRRDLQSVFDLARSSNPRSAATLVGAGAIPQIDISVAESALANFNALDAGLGWPIDQNWPVYRRSLHTSEVRSWC